MSDAPWVDCSQPLDPLPDDPVRLLGGKGANLRRLARAGQPVPEFYVVTTAAFDAAVAPLADRIAARLASAATGELERAADEIRGWLLEQPLPAGLDQAVAAAHARLIPPGALAAVRSSAADEDAAGQSFAGLHDSFLFVPAGNVCQAIRKVWASAYNHRALAYRRERGLSLEHLRVAVLVQRMIDARSSGVMFTANPVTGSVHEVLINALFGAGEGLVGAGLAADQYLVDKESLAIQAEPAEKEQQLVWNQTAGQGLTAVPLADAQRRASSLTDEQVRRVARAGLDIEKHFGRPQDVEFSFDAEGRLLVLQSRPVTTIDESGPAAGGRLIWDNSNIIESYAGVTSPMTFSFIRRAYTIVYHCFAEVMGVPPAVVRANQPTFENMLGLIRGRVYYNLVNWYRLIHLFPGFDYNARYMESMMGLKEPVTFDDPAPPAGFWRRYFVELPALARLVLRSGWNFLRIRPIVTAFEENFRRHYTRWTAMDFRALAPHELMKLYREMEQALLWNWKAPIINDFYVMIFYGTLKKLCASWCGDAAGSLQNDLICGEGGVESAEPAKMLLRLAQQAQADAELRQLVLHEPAETLPERVAAEPRFAPFQARLAEYLDRYGFRCMNELKLEEFSLRDRPQFLFQVLRNYLALQNPSALDVAAMEAREARIRSEAETRAFAALSARGGLLPRKPVFRWVLGCARLGVKNRENMRFARTRIYGLLRELLRALGARLAAEGLLDDPEDIFYLALDEVWDFVKGTAVTCDLKGLAALRRREFEVYRREDERAPDDRFDTFGMVYHRNRFRHRRQQAAAPVDGLLRGTGCCPGQVIGPVKVVRSPSDNLHLSGEILVAERTDPGWVPLYPAVSGLLIQRGSILSHSAVVAREMGIPTIVGIPHLMDTLQTGQQVKMDGAAGTVELLPDASV